MRARLLKLAYQLRYYYWGNYRLEGWLIFLAVAGACLSVLLRLPRFLAGREPALWLVPALLLVLALLLAVYAGWAARQTYVIFELQPDLAAPPGRPLPPADKVLIRATGRFEVEGKEHFFAHLLAYWRTFASREHTVMAIVHDLSFLYFYRMPERDLGMWYIFFCPEKIRELKPGRVTFGAETRPALRLVYQPPRPPSPPQRAGQWPRRRQQTLPPRQTIYLSFDDEATRQLVWADLVAEAWTGAGDGGED